MKYNLTRLVNNDQNRQVAWISYEMKEDGSEKLVISIKLPDGRSRWFGIDNHGYEEFRTGSHINGDYGAFEARTYFREYIEE